MLEIGVLGLLDEVTPESNLHSSPMDVEEGIPRKGTGGPDRAVASRPSAGRQDGSEIGGREADDARVESKIRESSAASLPRETPLREPAVEPIKGGQASESMIDTNIGIGPGIDGDIWRTMIDKIEGDRIAMAAFLTECTPILEGDKLTLLFHPDHTFHKESLEKSSNFQYLAGMARRHFGDTTTVDLCINGEVKRKPLDRERLLEKAQLACDALDGSIVKEE